MARLSAFERFCQEYKVKLSPPADEAKLDAAEKKLGYALPATVKSLYLQANGGKAKDDRSELELLSLTKALAYTKVPGFTDSYFGYLPLVENSDSNPLCVCCRSPLAGYVVQVSHDDAPRLLFRSLDNLFVALTAVAMGDDDFFLDTYELPPEFLLPQRTTKDASIAKKLISWAAADENAEATQRTDALRFACDLFADEQLNEIKALLKIDDPELREHVEARLSRMPGKKAKQAVKQAVTTFDGFVEQCGELLQKAGVKATVLPMYGKNTIRLDPGPVWLNMDFFYGHRRRPDFAEFLVESVKKNVKKK